MMVGEMVAPEPSDVKFVQRDDVIEQFPLTLPNQRSAVSLCQGL